MPTKIEWCDETWNPIVGCSKISEGCGHCYAERIANRFDYGGWDGMASFHADRIGKPYKWRKPKRVFVNSMGDLFHDSVPFDWLENVWNVMSENPQHKFLILTKRPTRMKEWVNGYFKTPLKNVWLGVTAENQERANERIPILLETKAVIRFVSVEPMLGPVDLDKFFDIRLGLDWVICGAETGQGKRKMNPLWAGILSGECSKYNVPFFGKKYSDGSDISIREFPIC